VSIDAENPQACWNTTKSGDGAAAAKKNAKSTAPSSAKLTDAGRRQGLDRVAVAAVATASSGQEDDMADP
jgi:hypothetical protein